MSPGAGLHWHHCWGQTLVACCPEHQGPGVRVHQKLRWLPSGGQHTGIILDDWPLSLMCPPTRELKPSHPGCPGPQCPLPTPSDGCLLSPTEFPVLEPQARKSEPGCPLGAPAWLLPRKEAVLFRDNCTGLGSRGQGSIPVSDPSRLYGLERVPSLQPPTQAPTASRR